MQDTGLACFCLNFRMHADVKSSGILHWGTQVLHTVHTVGGRLSPTNYLGSLMQAPPRTVFPSTFCFAILRSAWVPTIAGGWTLMEERKGEKS